MVLWRYDIGSVLSKIESIDIVFFGCSIAGLILVFILKAVRWKYILQRLSVKRTFIDCFLTYFSGYFVGILTPGRIGDFIKILYLRKEGVSTVKGLAASLMDKGADVAFLLGSAFLSFLWLARYIDISIWPIFLVPFAVISLIIVLNKLFGSLNIFRRVQAFLKKTFRNKYLDKLDTGWIELKASLRGYNLLDLLMLCLLTLAGWLIYVFIIFCLGFSVGLSIPIHKGVFLILVSISIALLPISIAGVGTRDLTLVVLFPLVGLSSDDGLMLSSVILVIYLLDAMLSFILWCVRPMKVKKAIQNAY